MIKEAFLDYVLGTEDLLALKPKGLLAYDQDTIAFNPADNTLYIYETRDDGGVLTANLLVVNLSFYAAQVDNRLGLQEQLEALKKLYFVKVPVVFLDFENKPIAFTPKDNMALLPNNIAINCAGSKLAFYNKTAVFGTVSLGKSLYNVIFIT